MNSRPPPPDSQRRVASRWILRCLHPLSLMAVGVVCISLWLGVHVRRAREEGRALALLKSVEDGRSVNVLCANPFAKGTGAGELELLFRGGPEWLTKLLGADIFKTVTSLQIHAPGNSFSYGADQDGRLRIARNYRCGLSASEMELVSSFPELRRLLLEAHPIDDQGAKFLAALTDLETLNLANTAITDESLAVISRLRRLRELDLSRTDVTDQGVQLLGALGSLKELRLEVTRVSEAGAARLQRRLPDCRILR